MKEEFIYNPKGEDAWEQKKRLEKERRLVYDKRYYNRHRK